MTAHQEIIATGEGASFKAYVSEPARPNGHAVIVLQEIFGITRHVRDIADRFAEDGYLTYAPDLFWRMEPGIELSHSKEDVQKAVALLQRYPDENGVTDITTTARHIRARTDFTGRLAVAGMCLGGKLAYLGATLPEIDAAVAYYGVGIERRLDAAGHLHCPLQLHFGSDDPYVSEAARAQIASALAGAAMEMHLYPGASHGFYTRGAQSDIDQARCRTNRFLQHTLAT